jgi:hypothetical protein
MISHASTLPRTALRVISEHKSFDKLSSLLKWCITINS